jgi:peroxiredoxin
MPDSMLKDASGNEVSSCVLLVKSDLVCSFYRAGWCPCCNLEINAQAGNIKKMRLKGCEHVAISSQLPEKSAR